MINGKSVAIIQARMGSTRLPGKVMRQLCGTSVLGHVIQRAQTCTALDAVVVATTDLPQDDVIVEEARGYDAVPYRGAETDVLDRYYRAATAAEAEAVVRITADCPLLDPQLLDQMLERFHRIRMQTGKVDYLSNTLEKTYPLGLDLEIFTYEALQTAALHADKPYEREHVTPYIYQHPDQFSIVHFGPEGGLPQYRWTLDTEEDFKLIGLIYNQLYRPDRVFTTDEALALCSRHPEWLAINASVRQKTLLD